MGSNDGIIYIESEIEEKIIGFHVNRRQLQGISSPEDFKRVGSLIYQAAIEVTSVSRTTTSVVKKSVLNLGDENFDPMAYGCAELTEQIVSLARYLELPFSIKILQNALEKLAREKSPAHAKNFRRYQVK